jgi:hypothetical protein
MDMLNVIDGCIQLPTVVSVQVGVVTSARLGVKVRAHELSDRLKPVPVTVTVDPTGADDGMTVIEGPVTIVMVSAGPTQLSGVGALPVTVTPYGPGVLVAGGVAAPDISPASMEQVEYTVPAGRPVIVQDVSLGSKPQPWMYTVCVAITVKGGEGGSHGPVLLSENPTLGLNWNVLETDSIELVVSVTVYRYALPPGNGADVEISLGALTLNVPVIVTPSAATLQIILKLGEKKYGLFAVSTHSVAVWVAA